MNGLSFIIEVRKQYKTPIVMCSGGEASNLPQKAIDVGANVFIDKLEIFDGGLENAISKALSKCT